MTRKPEIPQYCRHKTKDLAYVRLNGQFIYLGQYGTEESKAAYQRTVAKWLSGGRQPICDPEAHDGLSVNEVLLAYWRYAEQYYVMPDGSRSRELDNILRAITPVRQLYGETLAAEFGPIALKAIRQHMIDSDLCRNLINQRVGCIKRVFKWAVSEELIPSSVYHGLQAVEGLRRGRSAARDTEPVRPVPEAYVEAVLPLLPPTVRAMVELQSLTGMRSGELCIMRTCDIDVSGETWLYRPEKHKTAHHGHRRVVAIGPRAQDILRPFLKPDLTAFIFSPAQAQAERNAVKRAARKSRVQPSQRCRKKRNPKRSPSERYNPGSYYRAVAYGIRQAQKAKALPQGTSWHPHQLRHNFATRIRKEKGLDAARAVLGHHSLSQAAEYADLDTSLATRVVAEIG